MNPWRRFFGPPSPWMEAEILAALDRCGGETYGVPLRQEVSEATGEDVSIGWLYVALNSMVDRGVLSARDGEGTPERGGRRQRYFRRAG